MYEGRGRHRESLSRCEKGNQRALHGNYGNWRVRREVQKTIGSSVASWYTWWGGVVTGGMKGENVVGFLDTKRTRVFVLKRGTISGTKKEGKPITSHTFVAGEERPSKKRKTVRDATLWERNRGDGRGAFL